MKIQNNTISPETIDFYMQKGKQERSEAIFYSFRWIKRSVQFVFTILKINKTIKIDTKEMTQDFSKSEMCKTS